MQRTRVVHRAQDAQNLQLLIKPILHLGNGVGSSAMPRKAKNSHSSGIITRSAAVSALIVSSPNDGAQSIEDHVVAAATASRSRNSVCSRATSETS